jgi:hypothetical protein
MSAPVIVAAGIDRERLGRLLAMFSSHFDGEVVNAARLVEALRRESGLSWPEILSPPPAPPAPPRRDVQEEDHHHAREPIDIGACITLCNENRELLSAWESRFVRSVEEHLRIRGSLSQKQASILEQIARTVIGILKRQARPAPSKSRRSRRKRAA